jgi:hypothetical protein
MPQSRVATVARVQICEVVDIASCSRVAGISGTGWFLSPTAMVTVEHVAAAMKLSDRSWRQIEVGTGQSKQSVPVRIQRLAGSNEKIAVPPRIADRVVRCPGPSAPHGASGSRGARCEPRLSRRSPARRRWSVRNTAMAASSQARRCSRCTTETTALVLDHGTSGATVVDCARRAGSARTGGFAAYALSAAAAYPGTLLYVQRNALGTGFNDPVHRNATGHPGWKRAAMVPGTPLRSSLPRRLNKHAARRGASGGSRDDQHDAQSRGRVGT